MNFLIHPDYTKCWWAGALSWDQLGYYLVLPTKFIYHNFWNFDWFFKLNDHYGVAPNITQIVQSPDTGNYVLKYPFGVALLNLPFFFIAHLVALLFHYPADGLSMPYNVGMYISSMCYSILGLFLLQKILRRYFSDSVVILALLIIIWGTNYLFFTTQQLLISHSYLFFLHTLTIYFTIRFYETAKWKFAIGLGFSIGMAILSRPTEAVIVLIPLIWNMQEIGLKNQFLFWLKNKWKIIVAGILIVLIFIPQMIYWKKVSGHYLFFSYDHATEYFNFKHPHFLGGLINMNKGWLVYSPLAVLFLVGFIFIRKQKTFFLPIFIYFCFHYYVTVCWNPYDYASGFGYRPMVQAYPALAIPLAAYLNWLLKRKGKYVLFVLLPVFISLNIFQTYQYTLRIIPDDGSSPAYYKNIFLKANINSNDLYILDLARNLYSADGYKIVSDTTLNFENMDSLIGISKENFFDGICSFELTKEIQFSPTIVKTAGELNLKSDELLSANCKSIFNVYEISPWNMSMLVLEIDREGKPIQWEGVRIQNKIGTEKSYTDFPCGIGGKWDSIQFTSKVPADIQPTDVIKVFCWNAKGPPVFIDDLTLNVLKK